MKRLFLIMMLCLTPSVLLAQGVRLTGGTATGVDTNDNGKFDFLDVRLGIAVDDPDLAGFYLYTVSLKDVNGTQIGSLSNHVLLLPGDNTLNLRFDGSLVGQNGVDGPYFVSNLNMFNFGGFGSLHVAQALTTQAFTASQFEGFANDTTPPTLVVTATPDVLWPADHKMHEITLDVTATDDQDPNPVVSLLSVTSNQDDNATGDGNTSADIVIQNGQIFLRAERSGGSKEDRVYTITYTATDASGNVGIGVATVTVPHDQGQK